MNIYRKKVNLLRMVQSPLLIAISKAGRKTGSVSNSSRVRLFRRQYLPAHKGPNKVAKYRQNGHEDNAGDPAVDEKLPRGKLFALIGNGIGSRADEQVERHARGG